MTQPSISSARAAQAANKAMEVELELDRQAADVLLSHAGGLRTGRASLDLEALAKARDEYAKSYESALRSLEESPFALCQIGDLDEWLRKAGDDEVVWAAADGLLRKLGPMLRTTNAEISAYQRSRFGGARARDQLQSRLMERREDLFSTASRVLADGRSQYQRFSVTEVPIDNGNMTPLSVARLVDACANVLRSRIEQLPTRPSRHRRAAGLIEPTWAERLDNPPLVAARDVLRERAMLSGHHIDLIDTAVLNLKGHTAFRDSYADAERVWQMAFRSTLSSDGDELNVAGRRFLGDRFAEGVDRLLDGPALHSLVTRIFESADGSIAASLRNGQIPQSAQEFVGDRGLTD